MREVAIAVGLFAVLAALSLGLRLASWEALGWGGTALVVLGLVFSVPCAAWYHWRLHRHLVARGALVRGWYWNPVAQHRHLSPGERDDVMPWFYAGAAGWGATMLGCVLVGLAVWLSTR